MSTAALTYKSPWANGQMAMPSPNGPEVINVLMALTLTSAQVDALAANDIITMGYLPENCAFVDAVCAMTAGIDTGSAFDLDFGIVNAGETDLTTLLQDSILVDAGSGSTAPARVTLTETMLTLNTDGATRKKLGFKVVTAAGTAGAGTIRLSLSYRGTSYGI
jgi:hypothetical protein